MGKIPSAAKNFMSTPKIRRHSLTDRAITQEILSSPEERFLFVLWGSEFNLYLGFSVDVISYRRIYLK